MAASGKLVDLLESNLKAVAEPSSYQKLRGKPSSIKPARKAPSIKESPENTRWINSSESDD
jgi:hypothetical protein